MLEARTDMSDCMQTLVAELNLEPKDLTGDEELAGLDGWDSMAAIQFIAMADSLYAARVSADDLANCRTVNDLVALCTGRRG
jgi:acyl carrier protein